MNVMEDLQACRVCLSTNVKLYDMYKYKLKNHFEILSGIQVSPADNYPQYLCSYCTALLIKCASFRDRSRRSQDLMKYAEEKSQFLSTTQICSIAVSNSIRLPFQITPPEINSFTDMYIKTEETDNNLFLKEELCTDQSDEEPLAFKVKRRKESIEVEVKVLPIENVEDICFNDFDQVNDFDTDEMKGENLNEHDFGSEIEVKFLTKEEQLQEVLKRKESFNYIHSFYKCEHCYKGFIQDSTYKNHMLRHDPTYGKEVCDICKTRWPDARSLKSHTTTAHERKYICKLCEQVSKSSHKAKEHLKWHKGYKFVCKVCGSNFDRSTSYLTHLRLQHPSKYACEVCGESFLGEMGLNMHKKKAHRGFEKINVKSQQYKCAGCGIHFKNTDALTRHADAYENGACDNSRSSCFQCGENLSSQESLKSHLKIHDAGVRCEECNRNFAHERSFSIHYQRVHLGIKLKHYKSAEKRKKAAWVCEMCGTKCISNAALTYHQRTHTGEKPYQCKECPKKFSIYQRLKIHLRTHTGERPFKCSSCPKAFKHKAALNRHDRVHSGAKPYQCSHCGKTFSQSNSMKIHVRTVHLKLPAPYRPRREANHQLIAN